jgi:hypothetical protein
MQPDGPRLGRTRRGWALVARAKWLPHARTHARQLHSRQDAAALRRPWAGRRRAGGSRARRWCSALAPLAIWSTAKNRAEPRLLCTRLSRVQRKVSARSRCPGAAPVLVLPAHQTAPPAQLWHACRSAAFRQACLLVRRAPSAPVVNARYSRTKVQLEVVSGPFPERSAFMAREKQCEALARHLKRTSRWTPPA